MRQRGYFLTDQFINKLLTICSHCPSAAYFDIKSKRLTINDMQLFAKAVRQVDQRCIATFLKRIKSIGFTMVESENVTIFEWGWKQEFELGKEMEKTSQMIEIGMEKRKGWMGMIGERKRRIAKIVEDLAFELMVLDDGKSQDRLEMGIEKINKLIKETVNDTTDGMDEFEKIMEQEMWIYKNLLPGSSERF